MPGAEENPCVDTPSCRDARLRPGVGSATQKPGVRAACVCREHRAGKEACGNLSMFDVPHTAQRTYRVHVPLVFLVQLEQVLPLLV